MKQAVTRDLYSYWNHLRGERAAPDRADIEPADIRALLNDTFMLEIGANRGFGIRLAGARIGDLFLSELRGKPFIALFACADGDSVRALLEAVIDDPTPLVAGVRAGPAGFAPIELEMLLLPLGPKGSSRERVLGSLAPASRATWTGLVACEPMRLTSLRILQPDAETPRGRYPLDPALWSSFPLGPSQNGRKLPLKQANLTLYNG